MVENVETVDVFTTVSAGAGTPVSVCVAGIVETVVPDRAVALLITRPASRSTCVIA